MAAVAVLPLLAIGCGGNATSPTTTPTATAWTKSVGGTGNESELYCASAAGGGFIVAGTTSSGDGDMMGYKGGASDVWIAELDADGTVVWSKNLGGTGTDRCTGLVPTAGGFALTGDTTSPDGDLQSGTPTTTRRAWAAQLDDSGSILRLDTFTTPANNQPSDARGGIRTTSDGGFILAGTVSDGAYDYAWVVKFNAQLQEQWQRRLAANSGFAYAYDVAEESNGNVLLCGYTEFGAGDFAGTGYHGGRDGFVFELSPVGSIVQGKCFGGSGADLCTGVVPSSDGGFYVVGTSGSTDGDCPATHGASDMMALKVGSDFTVTWARSIGGSGEESSGRGQLDTDGSLLFFGSTASTDGDSSGNHAATNDLWLGKLSTGGVMQWHCCFGGTAPDQATSLLLPAEGGFLLTGYGTSNDGDLAGTGHRADNTDFIIFRQAALPAD